MDVTKITVRLGADPVPQTYVGRAAWALHNLIEAGDTGLTTLDRPAPRWSHYIFLLRKSGVPIETITEGHLGPYSGHHARYRLTTPATVVDREVAA